MHLIERYALNTGVKIDRPEVYQDYFPVPFKKFIVFAPLGKNHKKYLFWQEVINLLTPVFEKKLSLVVPPTETTTVSLSPLDQSRYWPGLRALILFFCFLCSATCTTSSFLFKNRVLFLPRAATPSISFINTILFALLSDIFFVFWN